MLLILYYWVSKFYDCSAPPRNGGSWLVVCFYSFFLVIYVTIVLKLKCLVAQLVRVMCKIHLTVKFIFNHTYWCFSGTYQIKVGILYSIFSLSEALKSIFCLETVWTIILKNYTPASFFCWFLLFIWTTFFATIFDWFHAICMSSKLDIIHSNYVCMHIKFGVWVDSLIGLFHVHPQFFCSFQLLFWTVMTDKNVMYLLTEVIVEPKPT